jgi:4'-phosphopantetheinyl transferase EntD
VIEAILPAGVIAVEAREDASDATLFAEEQLVVGGAVEKRRREFITARACARSALLQLGFAPGPIPSGERGEPLWPPGAVGSITHCDGYRACAVARSGGVLSLGIDAEPNAPLPDRLIGDIARPEELPLLRRLSHESPHVHWDRLLFSAKESVYKTWFPLARRWLGFEDAVIDIDPGAGTFAARLLVEGPHVAGAPLRELSGRWKVGDGIILTTIVLAPLDRSDMLATP